MTPSASVMLRTMTAPHDAIAKTRHNRVTERRAERCSFHARIVYLVRGSLFATTFIDMTSFSSDRLAGLCDDEDLAKVP
jgi:hypothetical protein